MHPAVLPRGDDEVDPSEEISGKHHADNDLEQEDEFTDGLRVGRGEDGIDGGGSRGDLLLDILGPLHEMGFVQVTPAGKGRVGGESVAENTGLLLCRWLGGVLDVALGEARLDAHREGIGDLRLDDTCEKSEVIFD